MARRFLQWVVYQLLQLNIVEGKMQYLFDESGRRYLDAFAGIVTVSVGHCHPAVVDAVVKQTKLLQHTTTIYLHHAIAEYAEALANRMPGNLKVLLPATSIQVFISHENSCSILYFKGNVLPLLCIRSFVAACKVA